MWVKMIKSEKICGAKKVETRQRSVRLVLDDWSTRPAVFDVLANTIFGAANRHKPLGATITDSPLECSLSEFCQARGERSR